MDDTLFSEIINKDKHHKKDIEFIENIEKKRKKMSKHYDECVYSKNENIIVAGNHNRNNDNETHMQQNGLNKLNNIQENICCICGTTQSQHYTKRHAFFKASYEYRCKRCGKYFYEHDMAQNPCFTPIKRL